MHVALGPVAERAVVGERGLESAIVTGVQLVGRWLEEARETLEFLVGNGRDAAAQVRPFLLDVARELRGRAFLDEDLDARLPLVVAAAETVVRAQDRIEVIEDLRTRKELADHVSHERRAAEPAADDDAKADLARVVAHEPEPDVVDEDRRAIVRRPRDRDLELARQVRELGVERRPLAHELAVRARVDDLVPGDAGEMI